MMKPRSNRVAVRGEESSISQRNKQDASSNSMTNGSSSMSNVQRNQAQLNNQQAINAQAIRKRRSSINVYDQPSSLNSRLRQLETDMLRLDEDRTKLFDDTHAALAQSELKLNEIHAILKSRQDNVEKYVDEMKQLLQAKEEFERQSKLLNEKQDRLLEKFMHRETTISREIKLLKNKFELLEKNRQFRSILQKSNSNNLPSGDTNENLNLDLNNNLKNSINLGTSINSLANGLDRKRSEPDLNGNGLKANGSNISGDSAGNGTSGGGSGASRLVAGGVRKIVRIESNKFKSLCRFFEPILRPFRRVRLRRGSNLNKVSSLRQPSATSSNFSSNGSGTIVVEPQQANREAEGGDGFSTSPAGVEMATSLADSQQPNNPADNSQ